MREKLHRFCAENRTLTLSAGILAARPHYPMRHAARDVEAKLKEAKNAKSSWKKDRVSFIGEPVSWEEFSGLLKTGKKLDKFTKNQANTNYTAAFLYRLLEYHRMYRRFRGGDIRAGLYLSHAHYDIARNIRGKDKTDAAPEVQFLLNIFTVGTKTKQKLERFDIPLFIAINQNRKSGS
jgi:CRISPR-associated protein Csm1